ncbi:hypothetical protein FA13DRAFT_1754965 [Coprinellus micaceus]|uniref:DUF6699 domain-containing protein n=1 Tax=Coprinellus micaceus TaxID=71717 RepID=A0A4Y7T9P2_COPMI|nr:hypothetical protein FA13DRAFT_1754965 [Coprinellus micaceus]
MSNPFVYVPEANFHQTAYQNQAYSPYGSPFVPELSLQGASPWSNPASLPPSPHIGGGALPNVAFPGMAGGADPVWDPAYRRPRQNSWHGPNPYNPQGLLAPIGPSHHRSNSFGQANPPFIPGAYQPPAPATAPAYNPFWNWNPNSHSPWFNRFVNLPTHHPEPKAYIHPWLNGESFRSDFSFNLSIPTFAPLRVVGAGGQTMFMGQDELGQLTIKHDKIPQWPIELVFNPANPNTQVPVASLPPISVGDILLAIHRELQKHITQYDFGGLNSAEEKEVTRAYQKRCKSMGPQVEMQLLSGGVRRCDFLKKNVMFKGLVRTGDNLENLRLITGSA